MDVLATLFPVFFSAEFFQTVISIALAAIVFFYFLHLLRKEEVAEHVEEEEPAADIVEEMQSRA